MTASQIQVLRAGPIQPIGLPPTAAAMGVTNARVLHRRMLNNNNSQAISNNNTMSLLGAKRCLFGSPQPGEIQNLYKEEIRRNRERFLQRYNYDIIGDRFVGDNSTEEEKQEEEGGNHKPEDLHNNATPKKENHRYQDECNNNSQKLIEIRLRDGDGGSCSHSEADFSDSKSNLPVSSSSSTLETDCDKECNLDEIKLLTITKDNIDTTTTTVPSIAKLVPSHPSLVGSTITTTVTTITSPLTSKDKKSCERLKPYSRQNLITEYYNNRKSVNLTSIAHAIEVSQLPKPQKAKFHDHQQQHQHQRFQQCEDV